MNNIILPDTSLCAIVRDEMINPAGGIQSFIESTVPYVEKAVIVDTGSVDGTLEVLKEMQSKYPNISLYSIPFTDYASCRNISVDKVQTKNVLILDADERIHEEGFLALKTIMKAWPKKGYNLQVIDYFNNGRKQKITACNNPRVFEVSKNITYFNMRGNRYEEPFIKDWRNFRSWPLRNATPDVISIDVPIFHFLTTSEARQKKIAIWYEEIVDHGVPVPPSRVPYFEEWKEINPYAVKSSRRN